MLGWSPAQFFAGTLHEVRLAMRGWDRAQEVATERASLEAAWIVNGVYVAVGKAQGGKRYKPVKPSDLYKRPEDALARAAKLVAAAADVGAVDRAWLRSGPPTRSVAAFAGGPRRVAAPRAGRSPAGSQAPQAARPD